jgi:mannan endo-1,4-beta-mannosidase
MNRVNTIDGRTYKDDATIMSWQLANEPQPFYFNQNTIGNGPEDWDIYLSGRPDDPLISWVEDTSRFIKPHAPKQLCTVGMESKQGEWYYKATHGIDTVD